MKYITIFDEHEQYNNYFYSDEYEQPNLSYCKDNDDLHLNDKLTQFFICQYDIPSIDTSFLINDYYDALDYFIYDNKIYNRDQLGKHKFTFNKTGLNEIKFHLNRTTGLGTFNTFMFQNASTLVNAKLPYTLKMLPYGTFQNCSSLKTVNIPEDISWIHDKVFDNCYSLTHIVIPGSVKKIGERDYYSVFGDCSNLEYIEFNEGLIEITGLSFNTNYGNSDYYNKFKNEKIESIKLPSTLKYLGEGNFNGYTNLKEIIFPKNCSIMPGQCKYAYGFDKIIIPEGCLIGSKSRAIIGNTSHGVNKFYIEKDVVFLGGYDTVNMYEVLNTYNNKVKYIYIDSSIISMYGYRYASGDSVLEELEFGPNVNYISTPYKYNYGDRILDMPNSTTPVKLTLDKAVNLKSIGGNCFEYAPIESFYIPDSVEYIGSGCFQYNKMLKTVRLPKKLTHLYDYTFQNCSLLTSINLQDTSIEYIGYNVFTGCINLTDLILPKTIKQIQYNAFTGMTKFSTLTILADNILNVSAPNDKIAFNSSILKVYVKENLVETYKNSQLFIDVSNSIYPIE